MQKTRGKKRGAVKGKQKVKLRNPMLLYEVIGTPLFNLFLLFTEMGIRLGYIKALRRNIEPNPYSAACTVFSLICFVIGMIQLWYFVFNGKKHMEYYHAKQRK